MLDLGLFRSGTFTGANAAVLLTVLATFGVFFFFSLYMQNILDYSPVRAGIAFLPMTVLIVILAPVTGKLSDRVGSRWVLTIGMTLIAVQLLYLSQLGVEESYLRLVPAMLIGSVGMASVMSPATAAAMSGIPVNKAGVGSAVINTSRQVGGSIGIAVMGAIVAHEVVNRHSPAVFVHGLSVAFVVAAAIALAGALTALALVRTHAHHDAAPAAA